MAAHPFQAGFRRFRKESAHGLEKSRNVQRLSHQRGGASGHRRPKGIRTGGDNDDRQQRIDGRESLEGIPAAFARHVQVQQRDVYRVFLEALDGLPSIRSSQHVKTFRFEHGAERVENGGIVVC